jgi:hypothetical protein
MSTHNVVIQMGRYYENLKNKTEDEHVFLIDKTRIARNYENLYYRN